MPRTPSMVFGQAPSSRWNALYNTTLCVLVIMLSMLLLGSVQDIRDLQAERSHLIGEVRAMARTHAPK